jgi:hypothetical protein
MPFSGDASRVELLPGTLDLTVLRTLTTVGPPRSTGLMNRLLADEA